MPRRKLKDILSHLGSEERAQVLSELLRRHPDLREEADAIAKDLIDDVAVEAGNLPAAEKVCLGIVSGLYSVRNTKNDGVLGWAPDFPDEAAADAVSTFVECYPQKRRRAIGTRIISAVEEQAGGWVKMLQRVVDRAASAKRRRRT